MMADRKRGARPILKPEPRAKAKARLKRQKAKEAAIVYETVWHRAQGRCEVCSIKVWRPLETDDVRLVGHMHHVVFRSRGGKDTPENMLLTCPKCHAAAHHLKVSAYARPKPYDPPF